MIGWLCGIICWYLWQPSVDRKALVEWHNHAKWLFHFCHPWESSCPGIKASSAGGGWWHRGHLPVQLWVSWISACKAPNKPCPPKSECTCSQFQYRTGYSLFNVISWVLLQHCCLWSGQHPCLLGAHGRHLRKMQKCLAMFYHEAGGYPASGWCCYIW